MKRHRMLQALLFRFWERLMVAHRQPGILSIRRTIPSFRITLRSFVEATVGVLVDGYAGSPIQTSHRKISAAPSRSVAALPRFWAPTTSLSSTRQDNR